jgi:hypothetical protein
VDAEEGHQVGGGGEGVGDRVPVPGAGREQHAVALGDGDDPGEGTAAVEAREALERPGVVGVGGTDDDAVGARGGAASGHGSIFPVDRYQDK